MEYLTVEGIKTLNGRILTLEQFEELECNTNISNYECCGNSGKHVNKVWYVFTLVNGEEIDIYL